MAKGKNLLPPIIHNTTTDTHTGIYASISTSASIHANTSTILAQIRAIFAQIRTFFA